MSRHLYMVVQDYISNQIDTGAWPENYQIPTENELAEKFNVSRITVKTAIMALVNQGVLVRRRGKGTFVRRRGAPAVMPAPLASSGGAASKKLIGFIIPWVEFRYSSLLLSGVETALTERGYHVIFKRVKSSEMESQVIREFLELPVDGLIVASMFEHFNDDIIRLVLNKFPLVLVEKHVRDIRMNSVYSDTEKAGALMVDYLLGKRCRSMGLITYPYDSAISVKERVLGFQAALVKNGMKPLPEERILSVDLDILQRTEQDVPPEIVAFLENNPELDSIAAVDALLGRLAGKACAQLGRRDIRIICCDEPTHAEDIQFPSAYIDQSPFEMGRVAAQIVLDLIQGSEEYRKVVMEPRLVQLQFND